MMPLHYVRCCIFCSCLLLLKFCVGPSIAKGSLSKYALTCARGNFTKDSLRTSAPCPCLFLQEKPKGSKMFESRRNPKEGKTIRPGPHSNM